MNPEGSKLAGVRAGLCLLALATVVLEVVLTRLFSVTLWYHFVFFAISVTMFGTTAGALVVYRAPEWFPEDRVRDSMGTHAVAFGLSAVAAMLAHIALPFTLDASLTGAFLVAFTVTVLAAPFVFSGVAVTLALTRFPDDVTGLYAADLMGAALACALVPAVLSVTDAPTAVVLVGCLAAAAGATFAGPGSPVRRRAAAVAFLLGAFAAGNTILYQKGLVTLRILWRKEARAPEALFTRWNSISQVQVQGDLEFVGRPQGWGLGTKTPDVKLPWVRMVIDGGAATNITNVGGPPERAEHLKFDVSAVAHHLRKAASVLVIGVGGGRDVQTALAFGQRQVTGLEINPACLEMLTGPLADYTGNLHREPRVRLVHDEARSWLARTPERFDLLQISLIDTWAATAAGAYVLSENGLYTVQAWKLFLDRLSERGLLSVSRWSHEVPVETMRALSLAAAALRARGVTNPRAHVALVHAKPVSTLIIGNAPLTAEDRAGLAQACALRGFRLALDPVTADPPLLADLVEKPDLGPTARSLPCDLSAPTDDRPFFFQTLKLTEAFEPASWAAGGLHFNAYAVVTLVAVLAIVLLFCAFTLALPLIRRGGGHGPTGGLPGYFLAIGLAYMLVEVSHMQRLAVLLGHPTYAMTVVLGTLLVASGLGSLLAGRLSAGARPAVLAALLGVLVLTGLASPAVVARGEGLEAPWRIGLAVLLVFPGGFLMGMPFPLGMALAVRQTPAAAPWLFGLNGAASITASVVAVAIAIAAGISWSFWAGCAAYAVALLFCLERSAGN